MFFRKKHYLCTVKTTRRYFRPAKMKIFFVFALASSYLCKVNMGSRADSIGILIKKRQKAESASFANGGPYKALRGLSCKAGGLQRRGALKTFILGVSSHHRAASFFLKSNHALCFLESLKNLPLWRASYTKRKTCTSPCVVRLRMS